MLGRHDLWSSHALPARLGATRACSCSFAAWRGPSFGHRVRRLSDHLLQVCFKSFLQHFRPESTPLARRSSGIHGVPGSLTTAARRSPLEPAPPLAGSASARPRARGGQLTTCQARITVSTSLPKSKHSQPRHANKQLPPSPNSSITTKMSSPPLLNAVVKSVLSADTVRGNRSPSSAAFLSAPALTRSLRWSSSSFAGTL